MTKKARYEIYVLGALLIVLAIAAYSSQSRNSVFTGVSASDVKFTPLDVPDPSLRLDLLDRIHKEEYKGRHRNIFSAEPLPPPPSVLANQQAAARGPVTPPPPPPVTVPATFYGIVTDLNTGRKRACFSANTDDVYIVPEGGMLLNQFRVVTISSNSVEVEELSSGRRTTLMLAQPTDATGVPPQQGQP
ncbi:MAG TPA: hypothetical protein VJN90_13135 [Candidatus Acidoferrales bacterium]|nr:hypothetical protein [Candidatus Acidoferrales bacterium]